MRKQLLVIFVLSALLMVSCQPQQPTSTEITPVVNATTEGQETAGAGEGFAFYQADDSESFPQSRLFIEPSKETETPSVVVNCQGSESELYAPSYGVELNNHCILDTGKFRAHLVLPDGSFLTFERGTVAQVNMTGNSVEVILEQGEVYNRVTPRSEGGKFVVLAGDASFEAMGTVYGVSLKDKIFHSIVLNGEVYSFRCQLYKDYTCMKWNQVSYNMVPVKEYTSAIGKELWEAYDIGDVMSLLVRDETAQRWVPNPEIDLTLPAYENEWDYYYESEISYVENNSYYADSLNNAYWDISNELINNFILDSEFNAAANDLNQGTAYCSKNPDSCFNIVEKPTMYTEYAEPFATAEAANTGGTTNPGGDSTGSGEPVSGDACAKVPAEIKPVTSCQCGNTGVYGVWCEHNYGEGWIPQACTVQLGLCPMP